MISTNRVIIARWLLPALLVVLLSMAISAWILPPLVWRDTFAGWLAALVNAVAAFLLNRRALGTQPVRFLLIGLGGNLLRLLALISIFAVWKWKTTGHVQSFLVALLSGYLVFLVAEIGELFSSATHMPTDR